jgi:ABC-type dipeptide/oligopeptide/nickel transport system permease component
VPRRRYIVKRTLVALLTVWVAVTLNFALFRLAPGDAVTNMSRVPNATEQTRAALREEFQLDRSKGAQYVAYLDQLAHGNLGISYANFQPVSTNLREALGNTLPMVALGTAIGIVLGVLVGILSAWGRGTMVDGAGVFGSLLLYAMPTQWLGLLLVLLFAGTLPAGGMEDPFLALSGGGGWAQLQDRLEHMILPAVTLAFGLLAQFALITRSSMLETLGEDYVLTARAKGLPDRAVVWRHAARNAMLPVTSIVAVSIGSIVGGAILVETVFSWPGIGTAIYESVSARDYPMLQGAFLLLTLGVVAMSYLVDLLQFKLDPRIGA